MEPAVSVCSSEQYAQAMAHGWEKGLKTLFDGTPEEGSMEWIHNTKVYIHEEGLFASRRSRKALGDIVVAVRFGSPKRFEDIFPAGAAKCNIQPPAARGWLFPGIFCDVKRTSSPRDANKKIDRLIRFYGKLLKPTPKHPRLFENLSTTVDVPSVAASLMSNPDAPIVFLLNGSDNVDAWKCFLSKNSAGTVHGHKVCTIFIASDELTKWSELQEKDRKIQENEKKL
eukprot:gene32578-39391_t